MNKERIFIFVWVPFLLLFAFLRLADLDVRPMHNDEGVNAVFVQNLVQDRQYRYDPENYHGPSLYLIEWIPTLVASWAKEGFRNIKFNSTIGMSETVLRSVVAIAGLLVLMGCYFMRRRIGPWGALAAFLLLGFSCDMVYYSRYFIHEMFLVLFTFGIYLCAIHYMDTKKAAAFYGMAAFAALAFTTKETSFVHFFILIFAFFCSESLHAVLSRENILARTKDNLLAMRDSMKELKWHAIGGVVLFIFIWVLFFTVLFKHWGGLFDSIETFKYWGAEGVESGHNKPFLYFFDEFFFRYEIALTFLTFAGMLIAVFRNDRTALYLVFLVLGFVGAYSVIPYKTPWLVINMLVPMALMSGYAVQTLVTGLRDWNVPNQRAAMGAFSVGFVLLLLIQFPQTWAVTFDEYDDEIHGQVYQHANRNVYNIVDDIEEMAGRSGNGLSMKISVVSTEYWPLPFYLREFAKIGYWGTIADTSFFQDNPGIVIAHEKQFSKVEPLLKTQYTARWHELREGVKIVLFIRKDIMNNPAERSRDIPPIFNAKTPKGRLRPGLIEEVYNGMRFRRDPISIESGITSLSFNWAADKKLYPSPFSIRYRGLLNVPETGYYTFSLNSDDGSFLYIDNILVVDNGGQHEPIKKSKTVKMEKGLHVFEIKYFDWLGEAVLDVMWAPPGKEEVPLPRSALFHIR